MLGDLCNNTANLILTLIAMNSWYGFVLTWNVAGETGFLNQEMLSVSSPNIFQAHITHPMAHAPKNDAYHV